MSRRADLTREEREELEERIRLRSQISMSLCNLDDLHAFFSPSTRRFYARTTRRSAEDSRRASRGAPALPADAVFVGSYAHGIRAADVVRDIFDALARPHAPAPPRPAEAKRGELAQRRPIPETTWVWAHEERFDRLFGKPK